MADKYKGRIKRLEARERKALRERKRARLRRREALLKRDWEEARSARKVINRKTEQARKARQGVKALRKARKKHSILVRLARHRRKVAGKQGLVWFDGHQCAAWIVEELKRARKGDSHGRWRGYVVSGYRTKLYSQSLCYRMCGRPACSGTCAGVNSNHSQGYVFPLGAVDVTDYYTLATVASRLGLRIKNRLPRDRVHFSSSGV